MKRRSFIKISGLGVGALSMNACDFDRHNSDKKIPIEVLSDAGVGHILRNANTFEVQTADTLDVAIIGGGIAGLTAFHQLQDKNVRVFELSDKWGGTSAAHHHKDLRFALGAHYDLAYPDYFGSEGLALLEKLNVIAYNEFSDLWEFKDTELLIPSQRESRCWINGEDYADPIGHAPDIQKFYDLIRPFYGQLPMPTRLIDKKWWHLNTVSFASFLQEKGPFSDVLIQGVDYQMYDDYGAGIEEVSALAGLHYYACRPYEKKEIPLFSPPEGNYYFAQKLIAQSEVARMHNSHLVSKITPTESGYQVDVIDIHKKIINRYQAKAIVMAGKKHTVPYLFPFLGIKSDNQYVPWVSVNLIMPKTFELRQPIWQNDVIGIDPYFQGYVNTSSQALMSRNLKSLTCYYCYPSDRRSDILNLENQAETIVAQTVHYIEKVMEVNELSQHIIKAVVKLMGHAMAVPEVGFLGKDLNQEVPDDIAFAGVDNGRLPLFFEALDSGIVAAEKVRKIL